MLKELIVYITHHGAFVQGRFAAILIALCLLIGIAGFSSLLSGATGIPAGEHAPPPDTTIALSIDSPKIAASGTAGTSLGQAATDTGMTPTLTPAVTPTEYIEQDTTDLTGASALSPSLSATSLATAVPTSVPSTTVETATSTQAPTRTGTDRTPRVTDTTERVPLSVSDPASITIHLRVQDGVFSPSSITVPAGAEVTIVFDNWDVGVRHNVVIYADKGEAAPVFVGTVITGPGQTTDTFTAPSQPGTYVLGCGTPSPHRLGTFIVK